MARGLDHIDNIKDDIQYVIHKSIKEHINKSATLIFYDVTNYYFCIDKNDKDEIDKQTNIISKGIRKKGYSKENRKSPIIQMGLFIDQNSIPIAYKLFSGNICDVSTYKDIIQQVQQKFGLKKIVIVADKAMNCKSNISKTIEDGNGYIFSSKFKGKSCNKQLQKLILDKNNWEYIKELSFAKKSFIKDRKLENGKTIKEKIVITYNNNYKQRQGMLRQEFIDYLGTIKTYNKTLKKNIGKYMQFYTLDEKNKKVSYNPFVAIDYEQISKDELFDGINVITTNQIEMKDEDIISAYHSLYKIEDCFRISKSFLKTRPVFVWKRKHIEAHFLTCFIALVIIRILEHKLEYKYCSKAIIEAIRSGECKNIKDELYDVSANSEFIDICKQLGVRWDKGFVKKDKIASLFV
jgi:transposase